MRTRPGLLSLAIGLASAFGAVSIVGQGQPRAYPSAKRPLETNAYLPPVPSSTPWAPSWSPDGKWIAVGMSGSIWKVDRTTGVAYELTYDKKYHSSPAWSPDGRWIVYAADDGGRTIQLEILNLETGRAQALTDDSFVYTDPVFSPDGTRVAYASTNPSGYLNIFVRPIKDGMWSGPPIAVTDTADDPNKGGAPLTVVCIAPTWTHDSELLFVSNRNVRSIPGVPDFASSLSGEVFRIPAVAGGLDRARPMLAAESYHRTRPDVSPDGTRFVFSSTGGSSDQFHNLYLQSLAGGQPAKLTFFQHDAFHPRWSPDGEWIAYISNEDRLPQLALLETYYGRQKTLRIVDRRWKRPMGTLSLRTVDAATGELVPSRIYLTASDGKIYAPPDAFTKISRFGEHTFHSAGTFKVDMPAGKVRVLAVKGFEFRPESTELDLEAGEVTTATVNLTRVSDVSARGWFNGSTHAHMSNEGNLNATLDTYMMIGAAEDEDVVVLQSADYGSRILDTQYFVKGGGPHPRSTPDRLLVFGQEYRPPLYGHLVVFGMKDHLMSPVRLSGAGGSGLYPSPTDLFRNARIQGATVGYDHAFGGEADPLEGNLGAAAGMLVDAALGTAHLVTWNGASRAGFFPLYAVWNNGLRITAVGGDDSIVNTLGRHPLPGSMRTFAFTGQRGLDMDAWFASLRAGHASVSSGPLVELSANGRLPGEEVVLPAGGGAVDVDVRVRSLTPLDKVLLVFNGTISEEVPLTADRKSADFRKSFQVTQSGWYHLRAEGRPADRFPLDVEYAQAFTNPIWVQVGTQPIRNRAAAEYGVRWIDKLQQMAEGLGLWRSPAEKDHVFAVFEEARQVYRRLAAETAPSAAGRPQDRP